LLRRRSAAPCRFGARICRTGGANGLADVRPATIGGAWQHIMAVTSAVFKAPDQYRAGA
jgi:hypothetical protein